jgi:hypothetical protein
MAVVDRILNHTSSGLWMQYREQQSAVLTATASAKATATATASSSALPPPLLSPLWSSSVGASYSASESLPADAEAMAMKRGYDGVGGVGGVIIHHSIILQHVMV